MCYLMQMRCKRHANERINDSVLSRREGRETVLTCSRFASGCRDESEQDQTLSSCSLPGIKDASIN